MQQRKIAETPRDAALRILKIRREMTLVELTRALKLTETAVRRHMQKLQLDGLVCCSSRHQAIGRPTNIYTLTEKATTDYFPTAYEGFADQMLGTIYDTSGHKGVFEFLVTSNQRAISKLMPEVENKTLMERVEFIARFFNEQGYMTDWRELPGGRYFLYHQNCAIYNLASKYRQLCFTELKLIEALAGTKVARQQYIFKNQPICGYLIN